MSDMQQISENKDFSSISPSARWMMLMKGCTDIPYARKVAELLEYPGNYDPDLKKRDFTFCAGTYHLESRYHSIDNLLNDLTYNNILELSSGFSFRSLDYAIRKGKYYIDTDLPEIINAKKELIKDMVQDKSNINGKLELISLNALDTDNLNKIIDHFPEGGIAIVNEGLLTYLDNQEQRLLCSSIHEILKKRGGCWITADIYIKNKQPQFGFHYNERVKKFYEQHNTENNSFESFSQAEEFFREMGFKVDKEAKVERSELTSFKYLVRSMTLRQIIKSRKIGKVQATWRLIAV
jgi:O-methyltransferase involved in polyketide biosynthesis